MEDSGRRGRRGRGGPALVLLSLACLGLLLGGLAVGVALGGVMPLPYGSYGSPGPIQAYVRTQPVAVQVIAAATFGSSVPLAIYAATACARLRQLGASATLALVGGTLAAGSLGLTGLVGWTLSRPDVGADPALLVALYYLVFLIGGPGHIVALGLLVAGMAVPIRKLRLAPATVAWTGVAIAALAGSAVLVLVWTALGPVLPIARGAALVWLVVAGALLARRDLDAV